jgi:hypothetical protein
VSNKIQVKRGLEANRASFTPDVGEPLWVTDASKLYIGDGTTAGGKGVSMDGHTHSYLPLSGGDLSASLSVTKTSLGDKFYVYNGGSVASRFGIGVDNNAFVAFIPDSASQEFSFRKGGVYNGTEIASLDVNGVFNAVGGYAVGTRFQIKYNATQDSLDFICV